MSKLNDYINLIEELWEIEEFYMWTPVHYSSLAYLFDRTYDTPEYEKSYKRWMQLAKDKDYNEFAWTIDNAVYECSKVDDRVTQENLYFQKQGLSVNFENYNDGCFTVFGQSQDDLTPDWFFEFFGEYIKLKKLQRENMIVEYLQTECKMSPKRSKEAFEKFCEHPDIIDEVHFYVKNGRFKEYNVTQKTLGGEVYTAKKLYESTNLSVIGAYNYLIYLRESPKEALEDLRKGLPRK